jgi:acid phosphatase
MSHLVPAAAILLVAGSALTDAVALPRPDHVVVVVEENQAFQGVIGNPEAPYLNALAAQGALFTKSFGVTHPSQPNYLALFSGSTHGVASNDCPLALDGPNLAGLLIDAGFTFVGYSETMPSVGYLGCGFGAYQRKHNPWSNFAALPVSTNLRFSDFPADFADLPHVAFVVPDQNHDMHDGTVAEADAWLEANLGPYVEWAATHDSLFVVTWDEDDDHSSNHIPTLFVGPMVKPGSVVRRVTHYDLLRTLADMYGLEAIGAAQGALAIAEAFVTPSFTSPDTAHGVVGVPFEHALAASGGPPVTFSATSALPPGLLIAGAALTGTPAAAGTFDVGLGASTAVGTASQHLLAVFTADSDGDGIPDELEPSLAAAPAPSGVPLAVSSLSIKLGFGKSAGRDSLRLDASVPAPPGFDPAGATAVLDVGGVVRAFTFDERGRAIRDASNADSSLKLSLRDGVASLRLKVSRAALAPALADEALTDTDAEDLRTGALVTLVLDGNGFEKIERLLYRARAGRSGSAASAG